MASSLISIPEYFTRFIDRSIDLTKIPKICCPVKSFYRTKKKLVFDFLYNTYK